MADSLKQLETDLDNLNRSIRAGITTVVVGGQTTVFASTERMQRVASDLENRIAKCKGEVPMKPRISSISMIRGV